MVRRAVEPELPGPAARCPDRRSPEGAGIAAGRHAAARGGRLRAGLLHRLGRLVALAGDGVRGH